MLSNVVHKAIIFATKAHEGQFRKGTDIPYIVHPMAVSLLAYSYTKDVDLAVAGLLHDTVEDTAVTIPEIHALFGERVAILVDAVTEEDPADTWKERKKKALERVNRYTTDELILKGSDVMANCRDILKDYKEHGENLWTRFGSGGKGNLTDHYILMLKTLKNKAIYSTASFVFTRDLDETLTEMQDVFDVYSA